MFYVGVDLGQRVDFTAVAVVEREEMPRAWMEPLYKGLAVRWLERMPLGTPYTAVARRVVERAAPGERALLEAYAAGVNAGLGALKARPFEYLLLRRAPEPCPAPPGRCG